MSEYRIGGWVVVDGPEGVEAGEVTAKKGELLKITPPNDSFFWVHFSHVIRKVRKP